MTTGSALLVPATRTGPTPSVSTSPLKVLCILGHPRRDSLGGALHAAFVEGAREAGVQVQQVHVGELTFDPDVHVDSPENQRHESDIRKVQSQIAWADHLVIVYPTWWGGPPARLKGLLDRCLTPGYAFRHRQDGSWDKLLTGKTAQLLTTMDTPTWIYRLVYGNPGIRMLERATLAYCGVRSVRRTLFSPVVESSHAQRLGWIEKTRQEGLRLAEGVMTPGQRKLDHLLAWLRALRLQFYPMSFVAYLIGALTATEEAVALDHIRFWIGYAVLFLLEAATVFTNERFDLNSDRRNNNAGPFNGGSRVLVEGAIDLSTMRRVTGSILILCTVVAFWLVLTGPAPIFPLLAWFVVLGIIAVGYTAPPLSLSHRGFGELDVAFTHSIGVMMVGHLVQGGSISDPVPWLLSLPLALSVLPAIILSGLPDQEADQAAGKRTLAVFFGKASAVHLAMLSAVLAVAAATLIALTPEAGHAMPILIVPLAGIHASLLLHALRQRLHDARLDGRINRLMVLALSFCLWFALLPLTALW